jgi:hypothetical protein
MMRFASTAFGPSRSTRKRNGWRFEPLGRGRDIMVESASMGTGSAVAADRPRRRCRRSPMGVWGP